MLYMSYYFLVRRRPVQVVPKVVPEEPQGGMPDNKPLSPGLGEKPEKSSEKKEKKKTAQGGEKSQRNNANVVPQEKRSDREKEQWEEHMRMLLKNPQPVRRSKAAELLGHPYKDQEIAEKAVAALLEAWKNEPDHSVRIAVIQALGYCGTQAKSAEPLLRKIVFETHNNEARRAAAEALMMIDPESAMVRKILRSALTGSKNGSRVISILRSSSSERLNALITENRLWALSVMKKHKIGGKWVTTILIDVCETEANAIVAEGPSGSVRHAGFKTDDYMDELLNSLVLFGQDDPRVLAHLKKYKNTVLAKARGVEWLRVKYDTQIKKIELRKRPPPKDVRP